jgi:hypothetical protein
VSVRLGKETVKLSVPTSSARSADELKHAIASACLDKAGREVTPRAWAEGNYSSMLIEFLDAQVCATHHGRDCQRRPLAVRRSPAVRTPSVVRRSWLSGRLPAPPDTMCCSQPVET